MNGIKDKAAIVGVALSEFLEDSGKTELRMSCEVIKAALDDAGLVVTDVDGLVKQSEDATDEKPFSAPDMVWKTTYFVGSPLSGPRETPCSPDRPLPARSRRCRSRLRRSRSTRARRSATPFAPSSAASSGRC